MGVKVREKKKGEWWIFIAHNGVRKSKKIGKDKKLALEAAKKIEAKLALGDMGALEKKISIPTFKQYSEQWLETYGMTAIKDSTLADYKRELKNHIWPVFGQQTLDAITRADVKQFLYSQQKKLSGKTVLKQLAYLSNIINHAIDDEIISVNPCSKLSKIVPKKDIKADLNPLNREEIQVLLDTTQQLYSRYYPFFLCAARTGMRLGELLALEWGHVDFHGRFIEVKQSVSRHRLTTTKSKRARKVDMSLQLTETLKAHKQALREEALQQGREFSKWVFAQANGKRLTKSNIADKIFHRCLDRAGLRHVRFHDIRHSYASLLIQQGESLAYVKEQMGHHSIKITVDIYGHMAPEGNKCAVDKLDSVQPHPIRTLEKRTIEII